jgi:hypothetical protein
MPDNALLSLGRRSNTWSQEPDLTGFGTTLAYV